MKVIQKFLNNSLRNFNYIIYSEKTLEAIFTDPLDIDQMLPLCTELKLKPKYLINTHAHPDHIADNKKLLAIDGVEFIQLKGGEELILSDHEVIRCIHTPGHVSEHYCFLLINDGHVDSVITGDTLFNAGVGHCKLGGDPKTLYQTTKNIINELSDDILIYPSHDYFMHNLEFAKTVDTGNSAIDDYVSLLLEKQAKGEFLNTTMGDEKKFNPFLRVFNSDFRKKYPNMTEEELFISIRSLRDKW